MILLQFSSFRFIKKGQMLIEDKVQIKGITYQICGEIGEGGVGHVFVVRDSSNNKFALKVVSQYGRNPIIKQLVDRQIEVQGSFANDPLIIQLISHKVEDKRMYILFELGSCSLRNIMNMEAHVDLAYFLQIAVAVCRGILSIHSRGMIHRDIKPQNIICVEKGFKITDFGSLQEGTTADGFMGSPLYIAPEMLEQESQYDQGIDVWSLGVTLFELYFKVHPFYYSRQKESNHQTMEQVSKNIQLLTKGRFSINQLLARLQDEGGYKDICESIRNKLLVTPPEIMTQFEYFFMPAKQRPNIEHFIAVFQNAINNGNKSKAKQCQIIPKLHEIPSDIQSYIITLNTFYSLCHKFGTNNESKVQLCLQAAIQYWSETKYNGQAFIQYRQKGQIDELCKQEGLLWQEIKRTLYAYWLQLSTNQQLAFFQQLPILKLRVLICGARYRLKTGLSRFLKIVSSKLDRNIKSIEDLDDLLTVLQPIDIKRIEDSLINYYNS